jgi:hypothetical protein
MITFDKQKSEVKLLTTEVVVLAYILNRIPIKYSTDVIYFHPVRNQVHIRVRLILLKNKSHIQNKIFNSKNCFQFIKHEDQFENSSFTLFDYTVHRRFMLKDKPLKWCCK